jgi:hypothetical protein
MVTTAGNSFHRRIGPRKKPHPHCLVNVFWIVQRLQRGEKSVRNNQPSHLAGKLAFGWRSASALRYSVFFSGRLLASEVCTQLSSKRFSPPKIPHKFLFREAAQSVLSHEDYLS